MADTAHHLSGPLDFARVSAVLTRSDDIIAGGGLDLSEVESIDSAGVALLLELTRRARAQGKDLPIRGASRQVVDLVTFFRLKSLLQFEDQGVSP